MISAILSYSHIFSMALQVLRDTHEAMAAGDGWDSIWVCLKMSEDRYHVMPNTLFFLGVKCETKQFTIKFGGLVLFITKFNG
jgi:hypothetical protein